jgi:ubiquinone biosynthesis protein COQ4
MAFPRLTQLWQQRVQPFTALNAMRKLLANPDDTEQVFRIIEALKGNGLQRAHRRLRNSDEGQALLRNRPDIVRALNDYEALMALPEGSIGRRYAGFVHGEGLSADGLIASSETGQSLDLLSLQERYIGERLRDIHDLQHVMTGYGRDPLGELCLLAFMTAQTPNRGIDFIIFMARQKYKRELPGVPIDALVAEGRQIGLEAQWMLEKPWEDLISQGLSAQRDLMGFKAPTHYLQFCESHPRIIEELRTSGINAVPVA